MRAQASGDGDLAGARSAAEKVVEEYGITAPSDIVLEDIAWAMGVEVFYGPIDGADAWLLRKGDSGIVRVNDRVPEPGRRRFAAAHELGHWKRHMNLSQAWLCTTADIHAYRGSAAELEANAFAASLLMPKGLFGPRLRKGLDLRLVTELADEFQTSLTAAAVRSVELSDEDCYVAFSRGGRVRWWHAGNRAEQWIPKQHAIDMEAVAWGCEDAPSAVSDMKQVPTRAWFPNMRDADDYELWEQSVFLERYDTVLSILCLI